MNEGAFGLVHGQVDVRSPRLVVGWGALARLGDVVADLGFKKVVVVTDEGVRKAGLFEGFEEVMGQTGVETAVFDSVEPEPSMAMAQEASELFTEFGADGVIGFGGGSPMDVAKAAAVSAAHEGTVFEHMRAGEVPGKGLPIVCVPTTAGSSTEVTPAVSLRDREEKKRAIYGPSLMPDVALVDPELTVTVPPGLTAAVGIDTLAHAAESYTSPKRNPVSDMFAERAVRLVARSLRPAVLRGKNSPEARYDMALAATLAGLALNGSTVGAAHAAALPFNSKYHVGHGVSIAVVFPHVVRYCAPADIPRYAELARWLGVRDGGRSEEELALAAADAAERLVRDCGIEPRLSAYGASKEDFQRFADVAGEVQAHNLAGNSREVGREDLVRIYEAAL